MAALGSSAVTLYPTVANGGLSLGETQFGYPANSVLMRTLKLVLTGQGGLTNTIGATALGFSRLMGVCGPLYDKTNGKGYPATVDPTTNILILFDGAAAPAPVDVTSTEAYITVFGLPFFVATAPV